MTPSIRFHPTFPSDLREGVTHALTPLLPLIGDLESLQVKLRGSDDPDVPSCEAAIQVRRRYHTAHLWIDPTFWSLTAEEQRQTLLHELMHVRVDVFAREVRSILRHWIPEDVEDFVAERLEDAEEEATDALAHAVDRLLRADEALA